MKRAFSVILITVFPYLVSSQNVWTDIVSHGADPTGKNAQRPVAVYGLEERNVSQLSFDDIRSSSKRGIILENTSGVSFHDMTMEITEGNPLEAKDSRGISWDLVTVSAPITDLPYLKFVNCRDVKISNCYQPEKINTFIFGCRPDKNDL